jgi:hypothetical protein
LSSTHLGVLHAVDGLYENVVMSPGSWGDAAIADWAADVAGGFSERPSKSLQRELRRCVRVAVKLRDFWLDPPPGVPSDAGDWRTRVDVALGIRAWRPPLEIARDGLDASPTSEIYGEVARRFREVNGTEWMEGRTYDEWLASSAGGF